jgi:type I restriction enzyme, S subunit
MANPWLMVPLGEVARHRKYFIEIDDTHTYKRCRVQLHARGVVLRDIVEGAEVKTRQQQVCRPGEFLVAEIDAKVGGYGIVPPDLDGAIVSSHYFLFVIDQDRLDIRFLSYLIQTPAFFEQVTARGSTNYAAIRPQQVLGYRIPLPPLVEQRRIVARIEELAGKVAAVRQGHIAATAQVEALIPAILTRLLEADAPTVPLRHLLTKSDERTPIEPGQEYRQVTVRLWGKGVVVRSTVTGAAIASGMQHVLRAGQLVLSRIDARNGAFGIVPQALDGAVVSNDFPSFIIRTERLEPRFLEWVTKTNVFIDLCKAASEGTTNRVRLKVDRFLDMAIPLPTLADQSRIVAYLDDLQGKVDAVQAQQAAVAAHLDALLPAILDRAFKSEL